MGSSFKTTFLKLSQFIGSDHAKWKQDYNADMAKIDENASKQNAKISTLENDSEWGGKLFEGATTINLDIDGSTGRSVPYISKGGYYNAGASFSAAPAEAVLMIGNNDSYIPIEYAHLSGRTSCDTPCVYIPAGITIYAAVGGGVIGTLNALKIHERLITGAENEQDN